MDFTPASAVATPNATPTPGVPGTAAPALAAGVLTKPTASAEVYANVKHVSLAYLQADEWKLERPRSNPDVLS